MAEKRVPRRDPGQGGLPGGKSAATADRIKLSATTRDIPSEPPRKSLESFADEGRFFGTLATSRHTHTRAHERLGRGETQRYVGRRTLDVHPLAPPPSLSGYFPIF